MYIRISLIGFLFLMMNCTSANKVEMWKREVSDTEKAFAEMASNVGIHAAFVAFAADDASILRGEKVIIGKNDIDAYYAGRDLSNVKLSWTPDFIDVAASGDMAYTYGKYTYEVIDSTGQKTVSKGIFHTVWKKQTNDSWKFVWD